MTTSAILFGIVTAAFALYLGILPILMSRQTERRREQTQDVSELRARFQLLLESIRDLDFDYDMGKIADTVYAEQRKMLIGRSVSLLMQLDQAEAHLHAIDDEMEAAIAATRQPHKGKDTAIENQIASRRSKVVL